MIKKIKGFQVFHKLAQKLLIFIVAKRQKQIKKYGGEHHEAQTFQQKVDFKKEHHRQFE
jgi:hypothetical protein